MYKSSMHKGHRTRVREKYLQNGLKSFNNHEIVELLLFYGIPRKDTNELAHKLVERFGDISNIMDAQLEELVEMNVPEKAIFFLKFLPQLSKKYLDDLNDDASKKYDKDVFMKKIGRLLSESKSSQTLLILHDPRKKELFCGKISDGWVGSSPKMIQKIVSLCIKYDAFSFSIARRHDNGVAYPTKTELEDIKILRTQAGKADVFFNDFFIFSDQEFFSLMNDPAASSCFK